jgi:hypothetical protein
MLIAVPEDHEEDLKYIPVILNSVSGAIPYTVINPSENEPVTVNVHDTPTTVIFLTMVKLAVHVALPAKSNVSPDLQSVYAEVTFESDAGSALYVAAQLLTTNSEVQKETRKILSVIGLLELCPIFTNVALRDVANPEKSKNKPFFINIFPFTK